MRKSITVIILVVVAIIICLFQYFKLHVLSTKDVKVEKSQRTSPADLKPEIIAKLKQLVKDGSDGLYNLQIDSLYTQLADGQIGIGAGKVSYDSAVFTRMLKDEKLPDDVFNLSFSGISIAGIGLSDLVGKEKLSLSVVKFRNPSLEVFHHTRSFNSMERKQQKSKTLFDKISSQYSAIIIDEVILENGSLVNHNGNNGVTSSLRKVDLNLKSILLDSNTQYDQDRFLFARHANIIARNYHVRTPRDDYDFNIDKIDINGETKRLNASGVTFKPVGGHNALQKKFSEIKVIYDIAIPQVELQDVAWWSLFNRDIFSSHQMNVKEAIVKVYVDKSKPAPKLKINNFPHQLLMRLALPVKLNTVEINNSKVIYYEYNPKISQWADVVINELQGSITNVTNIPALVSRNSVAKLRSSGKLQGETTLKIDMDLNLADTKSGAFTASLVVGKVTPGQINPITEPISLFKVKRGIIKNGEMTMTGNNAGSSAKMTLYYEDLHITPLKTDSSSDGNLKSKHLVSFIANKFLIKNSNPSNGNLRQPQYDVARDPYTGFIKLIWMTNMTGILKTIGIPVKAVYK